MTRMLWTWVSPSSARESAALRPGERPPPLGSLLRSEAALGTVFLGLTLQGRSTLERVGDGLVGSDRKQRAGQSGGLSMRLDLLRTCCVAMSEAFPPLWVGRLLCDKG